MGDGTGIADDEGAGVDDDREAEAIADADGAWGASAVRGDESVGGAGIVDTNSARRPQPVAPTTSMVRMTRGNQSQFMGAATVMRPREKARASEPAAHALEKLDRGKQLAQEGIGMLGLLPPARVDRIEGPLRALRESDVHGFAKSRVTYSRAST